jgi:hypothetical protein
MKRNARRIAGVVTLTLVVGLAACGGDDDSDDAAAPDTAAAATNDTQADTVAPAGDTGETLAPELAKLEARQSAPATPYVGKVEGTDAYIAVVERGGEITAYICDGAATALWFTGTQDGTTITATHPKGATLAAEQAGSTLTGTVVLDGATHAFTAEEAEYPAGLWQGIDDASVPLDEAFRYGWVVLPDGSQRGAKSGNIVKPVSAVAPATGSGGGVVATPSPVTTAGQLTQAQCDSLLHQGQLFWDAYDSTTDEAQKARILVRIDLTAERFGEGGCSGGFYSQLD